MQFVLQIGFQAAEILTLVFGILGVTFSLLLLLSPNLTRSISDVFNRHISIDEKLTYLDKDVRVDSLIYSHNTLLGTCLIFGSVFSLIFFFFRLDVSNFANIFFLSHQHLSTNEIFFNTVSWVAKVASFCGLFLGAILFFAPNKMRDIENKINARFETRPIFDKLNESNYALDDILIRHPVISGLVGLVISFLIIILSVLNFLC